MQEGMTGANVSQMRTGNLKRDAEAQGSGWQGPCRVGGLTAGRARCRQGAAHPKRPGWSICIQRAAIPPNEDPPKAMREGSVEQP